MRLDKSQVLAALSSVIDPEIRRPITELEMVGKIKIAEMNWASAELMANIENMQPLIEGATNLLEGLDMSKFEGITNMLSKFTGGKNIE